MTKTKSAQVAQISAQPDVTCKDPVPAFAISVEEAKRRLEDLQRFIRELMIQGVDYGQVPGCKRPTLYKPGAEKLADIFGFSKHVEITHRIEDLDADFFLYEVKAVLYDKHSGVIEAEGLGSCNSRESKYERSDACSLLNTLLKMAKKRAIVDAVLTATRSSGIFTQDVEDLVLLPPAPALDLDNAPATQQQMAAIKHLLAEYAIPVDCAKDIMVREFHVHSSHELSRREAGDFIACLRRFAEESCTPPTPRRNSP